MAQCLLEAVIFQSVQTVGQSWTTCASREVAFTPFKVPEVSSQVHAYILAYLVHVSCSQHSMETLESSNVSLDNTYIPSRLHK